MLAKYIKSILVIAAFTGLLSACEEDILSPVADKPYAVVHCVLNIDDTAHYVRLTKTFSGPVDSKIMAQNPDSLYFDDARVYLEMWDGTYIYETIRLDPSYEIIRDSGMFFSGYSLLYKTNRRLPGAVRLRMEIPEIKTEVLGYIRLLPHPVFTVPDPAKNKTFDFYETEPVRIIWTGTPDVCETTIRLNYLEVTDAGIDTCKLDWVRKYCNLVLIPADYLQFIANWIKADDQVRYRILKGIDLLIATGDAGMANYMKYRDWGIDIVEKPYSNLVNAYGFVGSRVRGEFLDLLPNRKFMDTLANSTVTRHLRFKKWTLTGK